MRLGPAALGESAGPFRRRGSVGPPDEVPNGLMDLLSDPLFWTIAFVLPGVLLLGALWCGKRGKIPMSDAAYARLDGWFQRMSDYYDQEM
jgi:hypothetical protein